MYSYTYIIKIKDVDYNVAKTIKQLIDKIGFITNFVHRDKNGFWGFKITDNEEQCDFIAKIKNEKLIFECEYDDTSFIVDQNIIIKSLINNNIVKNKG